MRYLRGPVCASLGSTPTPMEQLVALGDALDEGCGGGGATGLVAWTSTVFVLIGVSE